MSEAKEPGEEREPSADDCVALHGWSWTTQVVAHKHYWWWLPGSRHRAEIRGRREVRRQLPDQVRDMNQRMERWISSQQCAEPCKKVVENREPARMPGRITVSTYRSFVQVVGTLDASVDVSCKRPEG